MKLFVYYWDFLTFVDVIESLKRQNIEIYLHKSEFSPRLDNERTDFLNEIDKILNEEKYDAIFSVNFFDSLSTLAKDHDLLYICWTYDSPQLGIRNPSVTNECNRIFCFDSSEMNQNIQWGGKNLYYLPLAVDTKRINSVKATPLQQLKYTAQISLVGQLYSSDIDTILPLFDEYSAGFVSAIINTQLKVYGNNVIENLITDNIVDRIINEDVEKALVKNMTEGGFKKDISEIKRSSLMLFLSKAVTNKERTILLTMLAARYNFKHYTYDTHSIPNVHRMGIADYNEHMPLVFRYSKINLNTTLKTIRSGMPQRIIDIMGCHGLCLTNYQEDIFKHFEDGKELLVYRSLEEAIDKCNFYLKHEAEAEKIRERGFAVIRDQFNYEHQFKQIWEICGLKP